MNYRLSEVALLLGFKLEEARAWVRVLETLEPVTRDERGARCITPMQLEQIAAARVIASTRLISKRSALESVRRFDASLKNLRTFELLRSVLGLENLEQRLAKLEMKA
jgi:hypothetical protein